MENLGTLLSNYVDNYRVVSSNGRNNSYEYINRNTKFPLTYENMFKETLKKHIYHGDTILFGKIYAQELDSINKIINILIPPLEHMDFHQNTTMNAVHYSYFFSRKIRIMNSFYPNGVIPDLEWKMAIDLLKHCVNLITDEAQSWYRYDESILECCYIISTLLSFTIGRDKYLEVYEIIDELYTKLNTGEALVQDYYKLNFVCLRLSGENSIHHIKNEQHIQNLLNIGKQTLFSEYSLKVEGRFNYDPYPIDLTREGIIMETLALWIPKSWKNQAKKYFHHKENIEYDITPVNSNFKKTDISDIEQWLHTVIPLFKEVGSEKNSSFWDNDFSLEKYFPYFEEAYNCSVNNIHKIDYRQLMIKEENNEYIKINAFEKALNAYYEQEFHTFALLIMPLIERKIRERGHINLYKNDGKEKLLTVSRLDNSLIEFITKEDHPSVKEELTVEQNEIFELEEEFLKSFVEHVLISGNNNLGLNLRNLVVHGALFKLDKSEAFLLLATFLLIVELQNKHPLPWYNGC